MTENAALRAWQKMNASGLGRWLFTRTICWRAPYFASISPTFIDLAPGHAVVSMKKRRKVQNHIGTIHAIAMANLCEIAAGVLTEVTIPVSMRWLPRGMTIQYLARAETTIRVLATMPEPSGTDAQDLVVTCDVQDASGKTVVTAQITMYVTPKPARQASA
jgi:acyl-coenzyme A thioesterase PaaI-like protein